MSAGMVSGIRIDPIKKGVILVKNLVPSKPQGCHCLPGGRIEDGETQAKAMEREWKEETGQEGIKILNVFEIPKKGPNGDYTHYFCQIKAPREGLKTCETPGEVGPPQLILFSKILNGEIKVFSSHIRGIILVLEKLTEKYNEMTIIANGLRKIIERNRVS